MFFSLALAESLVSEPGDITSILARLREGKPEAYNELMPLVYRELRDIAGRYMNRERPDHTLQATALVNEAYMRLLGQTQVQWQGRAHFFAVASQAMRRILIEHARKKSRRNNGPRRQLVDLEQLAAPPSEGSLDLLELDEQLDKLEGIDPRKTRVMELRLFGGLTLEETAEVLGVTRRTVDRDWKFAKTWLYQRLVREKREGEAEADDEPQA